MTKEKIIERMAALRPPYLDLLKCTITDINPVQGMCEMEFDVSTQFCHSGNIVQGGFVTAMLDAVCAHAVFAMGKNIIALSTLELKVSYFAVSKSGKFRAVGRLEKLTRNFAFLSADLFNEAGERTANMTTTVKISYGK